MAPVSRPALHFLVAVSTAVCTSCSTDGRESERLATRTSAPIAFLRGDPSRELVVVDPKGSNERIVVRMPRGYEIWGLSWSPDGRRIVFSVITPAVTTRSYVDLYVVNADGSGNRRFKRTHDYAPIPVWSPRGDAIAFDDNDDGDHTVWVANSDGGDPRQVPPGNDFRDPAWSPDGAKIAYLRGDWIHVMNADGSAPKRVTRAESSARTAPGSGWAPAKQIVFYLGNDIWVVHPDGSGRRMVVKGEGEKAGFEVAPDGRMIAFSYLAGALNFELAVGEFSGTAVQRLTDNDSHDHQPSWAPDGRSLAFSRYDAAPSAFADDGPGDIYVINADGSGERNLTSSAADESSPAWSPKG
jgi:Tol biopolymer transport system component